MCIIKGDNQQAQQLLQTAGYYLLFLLIRICLSWQYTDKGGESYVFINRSI